MSQYERDEFFKTPQGTALKVEMGAVVAERRAQIQAEQQSDPVNILLQELERESHRTATTPMTGVREAERIAQGEAPLTTTFRSEEVEGLRTLLPTAGSSVEVALSVGEEAEAAGGIERKESKATADSGLASTYAPTEVLEEE